MYRYSGFSLTIDSELELPELSAGKGDPDVVIRLGSVDCRERRATIEDEIVPQSSLGRFHIRGGREIVVDPLPGADAGMLRLWLTGRLMAQLLRQRGCLPLHASGVDIGGRGVLFLGQSGAGKSTTAAAFYARGHGVLADDVGAVRAVGRGVRMQAAWPGLRLAGDACAVMNRCAAPSNFADDKHIFALDRKGSDASFSVKRIYLLCYEDRENRVCAHVIPGSSAVALLNSNSFLRTWDAGVELRQINLDRAASIASLIPVHQLVRPRCLRGLNHLVDFVEKDIAAHD